MIIDEDALKWDGQWPKLIHILAILTMFSKYLSSLMISLRCFHEILSSPGADKLLHLLIAIMNSSLEKGFHIEYSLEVSSFNKEVSTYWLWAELNIWCRASQVLQFWYMVIYCIELLQWLAVFISLPNL